MLEIKMHKMDGSSIKSIKLSKNIFNVDINTQAIFDSILSERASKRQGTHSTKKRGEVSGGGKKPWKQKGTGRARAGSNRSPIWVGGGVTFGPKSNRNYALKVNKKIKNLAFKSALTLKSTSNMIFLVDWEISKPSTKEMGNFFKIMKFQENKINKMLVITNDKNVFLSSRNLENVLVRKPESIKVEEIVNADALILSSNTLDFLEKRFN